MGVKTETVTTYICDCCGVESNDREFISGNRGGHATLDLRIDRCARMIDGAWGGSGYEYKAYLCYKCADKIEKAWLAIKA